MAEGQHRPAYSSKILCRYFMHGACRAAERCHYSHDLRKDNPSLICRYFQKGRCSYGDQCRYDHTKLPLSTSGNKSNIQSAASKIVNSATRSQVPSRLKPISLPQEQHEEKSFQMVTLKKQSGSSSDSGLGEEETLSPTPKNPAEWVKAAAFVPGQTWKSTTLPSSYSAAATVGTDVSEATPLPPEITKEELCPFAAHGECRYGEHCAYHHGDICDLCGRAMLHKNNLKLREEHIQDCMKQHEQDMELSFAVQRSKSKACGICMEVVWEKENTAQRKFGILSNCIHIFCLECIRHWRSAKSFEHKIVRACPECRVKSDFVTPSKYWVEDKEEKEDLIKGYKEALSKKNCKYFDLGKGDCPFNENCFYLHAYPDGRKASPKPLRRRRRANADGDIDVQQNFFLWDFLEIRDSALSHLIDEDELTDLIFHLNLLGWDSDDSSEDYDLDVYP